MSSSCSSFLVLTAKGDFKNGGLGEIKDDIEGAIGKALKRAKPPAFIGSWNWQKYKLYLYGYKEGRAGTENKHEIHEPFDDVILFGDAVLIASLEKNPCKPAPFTQDLYKRFYNDDKGDDEEEEEEIEMDEIEEEEDEYEEEDEGVEEDDDTGVLDAEEEEEEIRPMLRIKSASGFKKIAKWMHSPELVAEEYLL
jgi:hypothetical protein